MEKIKVGDKLQIHCYKHNGKIDCAYDEMILLEVNKDYIVFGNNKTLVTEADGRTWRTPEPAILYFFKNKWFNIISQLKKDGIYYYCNIATPYIIEDGTIKYIDYDLDLRIFPNGDYKILDRMEYKYHKKIMNYSSNLDKAIKNGLDELIKLYKSNAIMFDMDYNVKYNKLYNELVNNKKDE